MSRDEDNGEEQLDLGSEKDWQAEDDLFDQFDSDREFDDSDRDSDFAPVYDEDEVEEEEPAYFSDEVEEDEPPSTIIEEPTPWDDAEEGDEEPVEELSWEPEDVEPWAADSESDPIDADDMPEPPPARLPPITPLPETDPAPDWEDEDTDYYPQEEEARATLPVGLILVGVVALILLGAGGYGVMQQRAEMQEEVRQLRSQLATAANPSEVAQTRASSESLKALNAELESRLETLERENRTLQATVSGLERQLQAQQAAISKQTARPPAPSTQPKPAPKPAPKPVTRGSTAVPAPAPSPTPTAARQTSSVSAGSWFVNFGSYGQQATAQSWADRLQPGAGQVVVTTGEKDGRTFYRVRVIDLPNREQADATARILEQRYGLSRLWVGRSD